MINLSSKLQKKLWIFTNAYMIGAKVSFLEIRDVIVQLERLADDDAGSEELESKLHELGEQAGKRFPPPLKFIQTTLDMIEFAVRLRRRVR